MDREARQRRARWAGPLLIAICGGAMGAWTWGTWPDIVIDFGRELYVPWRITQGAVLYRDVAYFNGPLSPHLNALIFALFGVGLRTLVVANLAILAGLTAMLYTVLAAVSGRFAATAACLTFLTIFAFSQYNWTGNANYVCPYSHEVTHGMTLAVASVAALLAYLRRGHPGWVALSGLALGLAFLTKAEFFVAAFAAAAIGWPLAWWTGRGDPAGSARAVSARTGAALLIAGALLPPLAAFLALCARLPPAAAARGVAGSWKWLTHSDIATIPFFQTMAGWDDPRSSLLRMLEWTGVYLLILGPAVLIARALRGFPRRAVASVAVFAAVAGTLAAIAYPRGAGDAVAQAVVDNPAWSNFLRPLPVLLLATAVASLQAIARPRTKSASTSAAAASEGASLTPSLSRPHAALLTLCMTALAAALLLKMLLNAHVEGYGFAHAMPATLLAVAALCGWLPELVRARGGRSEIVRAVGLAMVAVACAAHLRIAGHWIEGKSHAVAGGGDAFYANERALAINAAVEHLQTHLRPDQTLVVFPEGVMLNYLARRVNPTPYVNFIPPELKIFGQAAVFDALQRASPDYVVIVQRPTKEYGPVRFGRDYAQDIYAWAAGHYEQVQVIGANPLRDPRFGILLARRAAR
jgi:hypothetical protein